MGIDRKTVLKEAGIGEDKLLTVDVTGSTNLLARRLAEEGAATGTAVLSASQTGGRGRMGRSFWSPEGSGMYLSVIIRPEALLSPGELTSLLTVIAGVCAADSIDEIFGTRAQLKWVNDIIINGKKAGGILTEGRFDEDRQTFAVIGIGVNIFPPSGGFPADISAVAGSVLAASPKSSTDPSEGVNHFRELLAGRIIRKLTDATAKYTAESSEFCEKLYCSYYDRIKWMFGHRVIVRSPSGTELYKAEVTGLSKDLRLEVKPEESGSRLLNSGEVSLKLG